MCVRCYEYYRNYICAHIVSDIIACSAEYFLGSYSSVRDVIETAQVETRLLAAGLS